MNGLSQQDYRRTRFSEVLSIRYKDFVDLLKDGDFNVDAVLQERTLGKNGHLVVAIRRNDTDEYRKKYAIMVLNKSASTLFPPSETIIDYIAEKLRDGNFTKNMHYMTSDLRGAYSNMITNKADMSKVFGMEKDQIGEKTKKVVIAIANQLKGSTQ